MFFPLQSMSNFLQAQSFINISKRLKSSKTIFKKDQLLSPMEKPIIFGFLYLEESILSILEENICADEFFLPNNIFVSLPIDVAITKRFDSCYLTISKSHFSVQQIRNIYLILNHSSKKKNPYTCFLVSN